jgi:CheY-like chemotaxis protein
MEAVGQLTGGIAHDFNNLLTVILGNAELLVESPNNAQTTAGLSQMILEAAERGADLTQKLLAFGRRQSLKSDHINLSDVVSHMMPLLRRAIGEHIELQTEAVGSGETCTRVDRSLLESAILNLVVNARDAMPQGGRITISTSTRSAVEGEGELQPGREVATLTIIDTGCGMPPEVQARVFEPFFTTKEVGKGTGLGLSMVYGFAQQSGGHVSIRSKEGEGTSITIALPLVHQEEAPSQCSETDDTTSMLGSEKVLVVEDDPQVLEFVASQLRSLGYKVTTAPTGREALSLLEKNTNYDLVMTDVVLPSGMSGTELASRIEKFNPRPKILLTSGYSEEVFQQHGRPANGVPLLKKPYKRADLAHALRNVLEAA